MSSRSVEDYDPSSMNREPVTWKRIRFLGEGTYGKVYKVADNSEFDPLKVFALKTALLEDASSLAKEHRIFEALGSSCPEIIRCFSYVRTFENELDTFNLLLEFAPYGTLEHLIQRSGGVGLLERHVRFHARTILKGLAFMHHRGYVHCDLKPDNILVFPNRGDEIVLPHIIKIADFGLAAEPGEELPPERWRLRFRGTPAFMSPESVLLGRIGPALDIWSLGCIVSEMLTGKSTWHHVISEELSEADFMLKLGSSVIEPMIPEHVSECGKEFLTKCFERDYTKRWSAQMLLDHPYVSA